jgi:hypothetical protein
MANGIGSWPGFGGGGGVFGPPDYYFPDFNPYVPGTGILPGDPLQPPNILPEGPDLFWDPLIPGVGVGLCPPGTSCVGVSPLGVCIGGCVPSVGGDGGGGSGLIGPGTGQPGTGTGAIGSQAPVNGCCPAGHHKNKSAYWRMENGQYVYVLPKTRCVRNRRRNPLNPAAADRSISRLRSASRFGKYLAKIDLPPRGAKKR